MAFGSYDLIIPFWNDIQEVSKTLYGRMGIFSYISLVQLQ